MKHVAHNPDMAAKRRPDDPASLWTKVDVYFSADVETDGSIPGPFSLLSFALVFAGSFDGRHFERPRQYDKYFYRELKPISNNFESEALAVNGMDRERLILKGEHPKEAMTTASRWVRELAGNARPVLVAYPLAFDWTFLYWYFVRYSADGSPFNHSACFDIKTAIAVKKHLPIAQSGRAGLASLNLKSKTPHTHNALDDAIEQADIFAQLFEADRNHGGNT